MAMHVITLETPSEQVVQRVEAHYPHFYRISDTCFLVRSEDVSSQVAEKAGLGTPPQEDALGAVFRLNGAYSGFASPSLWEWVTNE